MVKVEALKFGPILHWGVKNDFWRGGSRMIALQCGGQSIIMLLKYVFGG